MSTITSEYIQPSTATISSRERQRFHKKQTALKASKIWIGNFSRGNWKPYRVHNAWSVRTRARAASHLGMNAPLNTQTTTLVFGHLYLHVASSEIPDVVRLFAFPESVTKMILKQI
jgi:hypothetical protein